MSTIPFKELSKSGSFTAVTNEGDPIALAQEECIKILLFVYALCGKEFADKVGAVKVPTPVLRVCSNCVVLIDDSPDDGSTRSVRAVQVDRSLVETRLFGDPWMHLTDEYERLLDRWQDSTTRGAQQREAET